jgi:phage terminase large subunit GpA-like protein
MGTLCSVAIPLIRARALAALIPPPRLRLSEWIERELVLPEGVSALPGRMRLWPYQREIANAIKDPAYERVHLRRRGGQTIRRALQTRPSPVSFYPC